MLTPLRASRARLAAALAALALGATFPQEAGAAEAGIPGPTAPRGVPDPRGDEETRIEEVFTSHLPDTMQASSLRSSVHPHLGDFHHRDYLRISTGIRYGLTPRWEAGLNGELFLSHGVKGVPLMRKYGLTNLRPSTKYNLRRTVLAGWDAAVGTEFILPVGRPPSELTDGLRHYGGWITFSRRFAARPEMRFFWGGGLDLVQHTSLTGSYERNQFRDHTLSANGGVVLDLGRLHYSFETGYVTSRGLGGGNQDLFILRPGIIWEIPTRRDKPGRSNWVVGAALRTGIGPDGTVFGGSVQFRYNLDLKRLFGRSAP